MGNVRIADVEPGRVVEGLFAVVRKQRRHNRNGDAFLVMELSDSSGRIEGRVWRNADWFDQNVNEGDRVRVIGTGAKFRDSIQLDIRRIEPVDAQAAHTVSSFIPAAQRSESDLVGELDFLVGEIADDALRRLTEAVWNGSDRELLVRSPATPNGHHAYLNGLVEHSVNVAAIALTAAERHDRINRDVLLAAALLHDVGRAREIAVGDIITVDGDGGLVGHLVLGHEMIIHAAETSRIGRPPWWSGLVHAIQQHHSSADACRTREALVLAAANSLDARLGVRDR